MFIYVFVWFGPCVCVHQWAHNDCLANQKLYIRTCWGTANVRCASEKTRLNRMEPSYWWKTPLHTIRYRNRAPLTARDKPHGWMGQKEEWKKAKERSTRSSLHQSPLFQCVLLMHCIRSCNCRGTQSILDLWHLDASHYKVKVSYIVVHTCTQHDIKCPDGNVYESKRTESNKNCLKSTVAQHWP